MEMLFYSKKSKSKHKEDLISKAPRELEQIIALDSNEFQKTDINLPYLFTLFQNPYLIMLYL